MNRRSFIVDLLVAGVGSMILPSATTYTRRWHDFDGYRCRPELDLWLTGCPITPERVTVRFSPPQPWREESYFRIKVQSKNTIDSVEDPLNHGVQKIYASTYAMFGHEFLGPDQKPAIKPSDGVYIRRGNLWRHIAHANNAASMCGLNVEGDSLNAMLKPVVS